MTCMSYFASEPNTSHASKDQNPLGRRHKGGESMWAGEIAPRIPTCNLKRVKELSFFDLPFPTIAA
eukprot:3273805-Amphidinium_carterae.1